MKDVYKIVIHEYGTIGVKREQILDKEFFVDGKIRISLVYNMSDGWLYMCKPGKESANQILVKTFVFEPLKTGDSIKPYKNEICNCIKWFNSRFYIAKTNMVKKYGRKKMEAIPFHHQCPNPYYKSASPMTFYNKMLVAVSMEGVDKLYCKIWILNYDFMERMRHIKEVMAGYRMYLLGLSMI